MELLFFVLNHIEKLDELLIRLSEKGLKGATILTSAGMAKSIYDSSLSGRNENIIINSLKILLNDNSNENKTIFTIVDEQQKQIFKNVVDEVIGPLNKKNTGIMFTVPVSSIYGIENYGIEN